MTRPKMVEISVKVELPDGTPKTILVPPDTMAIFFDDKAVDKMLGVFYNNDPGHKLKRGDSNLAFGKKITDEVFGPPSTKTPDPDADEIELTQKVVNQIWLAEDESGFGVPLICKIPPCGII